jgi:protein-tyrosine phosphatase
VCDSAPVLRLCFVCLGNICRSPTAEGVMGRLVRDAGLHDRISVDSAGTGGWHVGEAPDRRSHETAQRRGIELAHRAWQFSAADFARFDLVLAMDRNNLRALHAMAPDDDVRARTRLLRSFDPSASPDAEVPDPYYGGQRGFDDVLDICERACRGLLEHARAQVGDAR